MSNGSLEVGDKVRIGTKEEFEAYVEAGGNDLDLLNWYNVPFGKESEITNIGLFSSLVGFVFDLKSTDYCFPEEMLFLV